MIQGQLTPPTTWGEHPLIEDQPGFDEAKARWMEILRCGGADAAGSELRAIVAMPNGLAKSTKWCVLQAAIRGLRYPGFGKEPVEFDDGVSDAIRSMGRDLGWWHMYCSIPWTGGVDDEGFDWDWEGEGMHRSPGGIVCAGIARENPRLLTKVEECEISTKYALGYLPAVTFLNTRTEPFPANTGLMHWRSFNTEYSTGDRVVIELRKLDSHSTKSSRRSRVHHFTYWRARVIRRLEPDEEIATDRFGRLMVNDRDHPLGR